MHLFLQRVNQDFPAKLRAGGLVLAICGVMYSLLQRVHFGVPIVQPACPVSAWLPFDPRWTPVYLSMFAMVGVAWLLLPDRASARRFARVLLGMEAVAWVFFFCLPMECPRPEISVDASWIYRVVVWFDAPVNCFPCLHSALTVLAGYVIWRELGSITRCARFFRAGLVLWGTAILVSILILRQHTAVDVVAGLVFGAVACYTIRIWSPVRTCS